MGAIGATSSLVASVRERSWRAFDVQLFLYVLLLIAFGVAMGYSASFNDAARDRGRPLLRPPPVSLHGRLHT